MQSSYAPRTESRRIRPFNVPAEISTLLDGASLSVLGETLLTGQTVRHSPATYGLLAGKSMKLSLPSASAAMAVKNDVIPAVTDCDFIVFATSNTMKRTHVLFHACLADAIPDAGEIEFPLDHEVFADVSSGFKLTVAIALRRDLQPKALAPSARGTWLCRAIFSLTVVQDDSSFAPTPLDKATRDRLALAEETLSYVAFHEGQLAIEAESLSDLLVAYLDSSVLARVHASPTATESLQVLRTLAIDLVSAVLIRGSVEYTQQVEDGSLNEDMLSRSVYARILNQQKKLGATLPPDLREAALEDPDRLRALVGSNLRSRSEATKLLARGD